MQKSKNFIKNKYLSNFKIIIHYKSGHNEDFDYSCLRFYIYDAHLNDADVQIISVLTGLTVWSG